MRLSEHVTGMSRRSRQIFVHGSVLAAVSLALLSLPASADQVAINEVMALNATTIADLDGDYSDWIELYNAGDKTIHLLGYGLSDDFSDPFRWIFPDVPLDPHSFLLVFASGKDYTAWPGELHTNFLIAAAGEEVVLTAPDSTIVDQLDPVAMETDVSYGRVPDGGHDWWFFQAPTPGETNGDEPPPTQAPPPVLSPPSGFYQPGMMLSIDCAYPTARIRFTLDGSTPGDSSHLYTDAFPLDSVTVVRAQAFVHGMFPSVVVSGSYIVGYETVLPVFSLITDPPNLWDEERGIYVMGPNADPDPPHEGANFWQDWEIPVHFDYFEPGGTLGISMAAGAKIHGGWSRIFPQKSLRVTARNEYGPTQIEFPFFPDLPIYSFNSVVLRNSGNDWQYTMIRDPLMTGLTVDSGIASAAYRPLVLFLNGEYWGIHNLREHLNRHYLASHYGVDADNVDIIENHHEANAGDTLAYHDLIAFVEGHDMSENRPTTIFKA